VAGHEGALRDLLGLFDRWLAFLLQGLVEVIVFCAGEVLIFDVLLDDLPNVVISDILRLLKLLFALLTPIPCTVQVLGSCLFGRLVGKLSLYRSFLLTKVDLERLLVIFGLQLPLVSLCCVACLHQNIHVMQLLIVKLILIWKHLIISLLNLSLF
jgi:hypothetical protein